MDRRSFLQGAAVAPLAAMITVTAPLPGSASAISRISCERGDPGEVAYGKLCADDKTVKVFLDGIEQKFAVTADAAEGWVKRGVVSDGGRHAFNRATGEMLFETAHGHVEIRVEGKRPEDDYRYWARDGHGRSVKVAKV